jgi:hypothetical protein
MDFTVGIPAQNQIYPTTFSKSLQYQLLNKSGPTV